MKTDDFFERAAAQLRHIARNDYMIDKHFLPTGAILNSIADELEKRVKAAPAEFLIGQRVICEDAYIVYVVSTRVSDGTELRVMDERGDEWYARIENLRPLPGGQL